MQLPSRFNFSSATYVDDRENVSERDVGQDHGEGAGDVVGRRLGDRVVHAGRVVEEDHPEEQGHELKRLTLTTAKRFPMDRLVSTMKRAPLML